MRLRQFWKNDTGLAALEFGLLGPIFFALILVLIDLSYYFASRSIVEDAVENGSRFVRLGLLQSEDGEDEFRAALCGHIMFLKCERFTFSVEPVATTLSTDDFNPFFDDDGNLSVQTFNPGKSEQLVVITIAYKHDFILPYVGELFGDDGLTDPNSQIITSYLVIKNEPYPDAEEP